MLSSVVFDVSSSFQKCWYFIGWYLKLKKIVSEKKEKVKSSLIYTKCHNFDFHSNEVSSLLQKKPTLSLKGRKNRWCTSDWSKRPRMIPDSWVMAEVLAPWECGTGNLSKAHQVLPTSREAGSGRMGKARNFYHIHLAEVLFCAQQHFSFYPARWQDKFGNN